MIWLKRVKKYGKESINTLWISDWFTCPQHIQDFALMFSEHNRIVESDEWDNLKPENGLTGGRNGICKSSTRIKISISNKGKKYSDEINSKKARHGSNNGMYGVRRFGKDSPHYNKSHTEFTKNILKIKAKNRERLVCPHCGKINDSSNSRKHHFDKCKKSPLFGIVEYEQKKMIARVCRLDNHKELDAGNWAKYIKKFTHNT